MNDYKHFISLGYFCSPALELKRMGLRDGSYPFDWLISDLEGVIDAIENQFSRFFEYELFEQNKSMPHVYQNSYYHFQFYHDFDQYRSLKEQFFAFQEKYERRIDRFYRSITEPTLFLRYISDEGLDENDKSLELIALEKQYDRIMSLIRSYNQKNDILWVANEGVVSPFLNIFHVQKDENDNVARQFLDKSEPLKTILADSTIPRESNKLWDAERQVKQMKRQEESLSLMIRRRLKMEYRHKKQY